MSSIDSILTIKLQDLPTIIMQEISSYTAIQSLQSQAKKSHSSSILIIILIILHYYYFTLNWSRSAKHFSSTGTYYSSIWLQTKEFHVSHLLKLLETISLATYSLRDLKIFHDTIQCHFATVSISSTIFPKCNDLKLPFTFPEHLCSSTRNPNLNLVEVHNIS